MAQLTVARRYISVSAASVWRGLIAGFAGTVAMTLLTYVAPLMGFPPMDLPMMLGTMLFAPTVAFWPGLAVHFTIGLVLALGYALFFANLLPGRPWLRGALYGFVPWLLAMVVVMPMVGLVHPLVRAGMMPNPGFFLVGMGTVLAPIGSLLGHLVYGAVLGLVYGKPKAS
ncbi:MAG: DUF6789 family protein [Chloroflexota bacterium]